MFGQLVIGPAGSGKTTYCKSLAEHSTIAKSVKNIKIINLDPGAIDNSAPQTDEISQINNKIDYVIDIRDLITVEEVLQEANEGDDEDKLVMGPNAALIYCIEYLMKDISWFADQISEKLVDDDYILFDCPGQIELYSHVQVFRDFIKHLINRFDFRLCGIFLVDAPNFLVDIDKYMSVTLVSLSVMVNFEFLPFVNVFSKMDLLAKNKTLILSFATFYLQATREHESDDLDHTSPDNQSDSDSENIESDDSLSEIAHPSLELYHHYARENETQNVKLQTLTQNLTSIVDNYDLIKFFPLNLKKPKSIEAILYQINTILQYEDELEPKEANYEDLSNVSINADNMEEGD